MKQIILVTDLINQSVWTAITVMLPFFASSIRNAKFVGLAQKVTDVQDALDQYEEYFCNQILGYQTQEESDAAYQIPLTETVLHGQLYVTITDAQIMQVREDISSECWRSCLAVDMNFTKNPQFGKVLEAFGKVHALIEQYFEE